MSPPLLYCRVFKRHPAHHGLDNLVVDPLLRPPASSHVCLGPCPVVMIPASVIVPSGLLATTTAGTDQTSGPGSGQ